MANSNKLRTCLPLLLGLGLSAPIARLLAEEKVSPIHLFTGRDLNGWKAVAKPAADGKAGDPSKTWSVENGVLRGTGKPNGYLVTEKEYGDYTLTLKYRFPAGTEKPNSGVLLHVTGPNRYWPHSIEAQMKAGAAGDFWLNADEKDVLPRLEVPAGQFDGENKQKRHYFRLDRAAKIEKPLGEWNEYEIECKGGSIVLLVNGHKANAATGGGLTRGRIGLQSEGSPVEFKEIALRMKP